MLWVKANWILLFEPALKVDKVGKTKMSWLTL